MEADLVYHKFKNIDSSSSMLLLSKPTLFEKNLKLKKLFDSLGFSYLVFLPTEEYFKIYIGFNLEINCVQDVKLM